ncbi:hypothetical protein Moror_12864 [Moniliophthora roreri MCA 2997]|uniref:Uncharacterized protein n=2 Tax=Moniliophthora roreri TaxID=221103 RepID=V2X4F2_MONRO|nr:hypothetical protein Moror_12864 [Moniliophthora roreri MCA 2997]KAI3607714.1 hypothetical protein WG66_004853 [Moniliophthora roreri]
MVKELIPKPTCKSCIDSPKLIGEFLSEMNIMNIQRYKEFKKCVRDVAKEKLPDTHRKHQEHDTMLWREVVHLVAVSFPELKTCINSWPVEAYYRAWTSFKRWKNASATSKATSARTTAAPVRMKYIWIGRAPPHVRKLGYNDEGKLASTRRRGSLHNQASHDSKAVDGKTHVRDSATDAGFSRNMVFRRSQSVKIELSESHYLSPIPTSSSISQSRSCLRRCAVSVKTYPEICFSCGGYPQILAEHRIELEAFLTRIDMKYLLQSLISFGIFHDGHLELLLSLSKPDRKEILAGLGLGRMDSITLLQQLDSVAPIKTTQSPDPKVAEADIADFDRRMQAIYRCPLHPLRGDFSPKLFMFLRSMQLEILLPIATKLYGIESDVQFERVCQLEEEELNAFMNVDGAGVSSFHQRLLHLAIKGASIAFGPVD